MYDLKWEVGSRRMAGIPQPGISSHVDPDIEARYRERDVLSDSV
jgi:hypothetical protein